MRRKPYTPLKLTGKYLLALLLIAFALVPFMWVLSTSFNAVKSLLGANLFPEKFTVANYVDLLSSRTLNFSLWMFNSLKISLISVVLIVFITCISAYALSRFRFAGKRGIMTAIMILNVFPGILAMIAIFVLMQQLGNYIPFLGVNTHGALIAVYVATGMSINTLMMKSYIDTIPKELDESAWVEGAGHWKTFWLITFPIIRPMVITVAILAFIYAYGDFVVANVLLKGNDNITVMVGIFQFTQQRFDTDWGIVTAGTIIAAIPAIIIFFVAQKYILQGLITGSVKG